jgi:ABC-type Fe3+-hydroxamate transport system substrate-binding protein
MIIPQGTLGEHQLISPHKKIISLVPSITWLLFDLQLRENIIGVTKFCKAANNLHLSVTKIGGTKNPDLKKINKLKPNLILANKEENRKEDIEALAINHLVYLSDVRDLNGMYQMIHEISMLTGRTELALDLIVQIKLKREGYFTFNQNQQTIEVGYLIWKDPYMTVGADTFIHYMLELAGFKNSFEELSRYPIVTMNDLQNRNPSLILLSSEPYPFAFRHLDEFKPLKARLVDGRIFSWYGTFILQSFEYLNAFKKSLNSSI